MKNTVYNLVQKFRGLFSIDESRNILLMMIYLSKYYNNMCDLLRRKSCNTIPNELDSYLEILQDIRGKNLIDEKYLNLYERCYKELKEVQESSNMNLNSIFEAINLINPNSFAEISKLLVNYSNDNETNSIVELNELVYKILADVKGDNIVDLCSGVGSFLGYVGEKNHSLKLYGQEINTNSLFVSELYLAINDLNFDLYPGDLLKDNKLTSNKIKYNRLYSNFPWLLKLRNSDIESINNNYWNSLYYSFTSRNTSDWIFSTILVNMMSHDGKAIALVANGSLFKLTDSEIREEFISKGLIEAIIQLPENIFSFTNISSSLIVFSHNNDSIKFVDASKLFKKERRVNLLKASEIYEAYKSEFSDLLVSVSKEEVLKNDSSLLVSNYVSLSELKLINPTPLETLVEKIFRGYQITASQLDKFIVDKKSNPYNYEVLQLSDIEEGIISSKLIKIDSKDLNLDKYLLEDGDVIVSAKSSKVKSAIVSFEFDRKVVATGSIIVIRPNKKLNPAYLKVFFDSNEGKALLNSIQTGSVIVSINPSRLLKMNISFPPKELQDKLGNKYMAKLDLIKITKNKLKTLEKEIQGIYDLESVGEKS